MQSCSAPSLALPACMSMATMNAGVDCGCRGVTYTC